MALDAEIYVPAEDEEDDGGDYHGDGYDGNDAEEEFDGDGNDGNDAEEEFDGDGNDGNDTEEEFDGEDNPAQVEDDGENNGGEEEDDEEDDDPAAECLICSLCIRACWDTHESLVQHRKRHKNKRKDRCSLCGRRFTDDDVFDNHVCECRN